MSKSVVFAYASTNSIPSAGAQRKTYSCVHANDYSFEVVKVEHDLSDYSRTEDVVGTRLKLNVKLGASVLALQADRDFFTAFFKAACKWVVYGNFKDTANSANQNLCKCITDDDIEVSIPYDKENGYEFRSEKVY